MAPLVFILAAGTPFLIGRAADLYDAALVAWCLFLAADLLRSWSSHSWWMHNWDMRVGNLRSGGREGGK